MMLRRGNIRVRLPVIWVVLTGFLVRLAWMWHASPFPVSDFNDYRTIALGILDHGQFGYPEPTAFFLPLHPTYLAVFALVSRSDRWLSFSMVLVSTLSIVLVHRVACRTVGSGRAALVAAWIFALLPTFVAYSPVLATEHLLVAFMLGAILALTHLQTAPLRYAAIAGLLLGLAVLTRGEAVFYIPAALLWIWFGWQTGGTNNKLKTSAVMGAVIAVIVMPWYVRNAIVVSSDAGLSTSAGLNFYFAHNDTGNYGDFIEGNKLYGLPPPEASRLGWQLGLEHIRAHPLNLVRDAWTGTQRLFAAPDYAVFWSTQGAEYRGDPDFTQQPVRFSTGVRDLARITNSGLVALAVMSLVALPVWRRSFRYLILPLIAAGWVLRTVLYWAQPRYAYFVDVMLVFAVAVTICALLEGVRSSRSSRTPG